MRRWARTRRPTFDPGSYIQEELNVNFDVAYPLSDAVTLAGGAECRDEKFEIGAGQIESWDIGPLAGAGLQRGLQRLPRLQRPSPATGAAATTPSTATSNGAPIDRWLVDLAVRFEDFEDFGTTTNGKLAAAIASTKRSRCAAA